MLKIAMQMKTQTVVPKFCFGVALSLVAGIGGASLLFAQPTLAQVSSGQPVQDWQKTQDGGTDPFSRTSGQSSGVFDLIHRATLGNLRDMDEFTAEQRTSINDAAKSFRDIQRKRILEQRRQATPAAPTVPLPEVAN